LTCSACSLEWQQATRSSAYLTTTGLPGLVSPAVLPEATYRTPAASSSPWSATFSISGLLTPPCGVPSLVGASIPSSTTPAFSQPAIMSLAGNDPSAASSREWSILSNAADKSASTIHIRLLLPFSVVNSAAIASAQPRPGRNP